MGGGGLDASRTYPENRTGVYGRSDPPRAADVFGIPSSYPYTADIRMAMYAKGSHLGISAVSFS